MLLLQPPYGAFGAKYIMEIPDTVVEGHEGFTEGSEEYMVFEKVLLTEAARVGLHPVSSTLPLQPQLHIWFAAVAGRA
jgi:hypothetical protein